MEKEIKIYIDDLLKENQCLFAFNEDIQEQRKQLKQKLLLLTESNGTTEDLSKMGGLCGKLCGLAVVYKRNRKEIKENLRKIEGLRNGTIKEI